MFSQQDILPIYFIISNILFLILYPTLSSLMHSQFLYILILRMIAMFFGLLALGLILKNTLRKKFLFIFFAFYFVTYVIMAFDFVFNGIIDAIFFADLIIGCCNLPTFYFLVNNVTEEHNEASYQSV